MEQKDGRWSVGDTLSGPQRSSAPSAVKKQSTNPDAELNS